jgi:hypothetical protein
MGQPKAPVVLGRRLREPLEGMANSASLSAGLAIRVPTVCFAERFREAYPAARPPSAGFRNRRRIAYKHLYARVACFQFHCQLDLWNETLRSAHE